MARRITIVVAMDRRRAIGRDGTMPWHLPADLRHFKEVTLGHPIIMGRRTWESIGRPLPGRRNIVVSRSLPDDLDGCEVVRSLAEALARCGDDEVMVIGGGEIYRQALELADRMLVTEVETEVEGADTFFPPVEEDTWRESARQDRPADERNPHAMSFVEYLRRNSGAGP